MIKETITAGNNAGAQEQEPEREYLLRIYYKDAQGRKTFLIRTEIFNDLTALKYRTAFLNSVYFLEQEF